MAEMILSILIVFIYLYISYSSFGYDDEFYNIRLIREFNWTQLLQFVEQNDVHPPLSYLLNKLLFSFFGNWTAVRMISASLFLVALFYLINKTKDSGKRILLLLLIGLNPATMLWVTGIRWYAYVLPLLLILHVVPDYKNKWYWPKFFFISLIICFLGYIGIFLSLTYFIFYWMNDPSKLMDKIKRILFPALICLLLYGYQLIIFLTVHIKNDLPENQQSFDLKTSLISYISSIFSNQGVFPITIVGIISMVGMAIVLIISILSVFKNKQTLTNLVLLISTSLLFIITGIAGKVRNLFLLEPSKNIFITQSKIIRFKTVYFVGFCCIIIGNIYGSYNVLTHQGTSKNSWNIDIQTSMKFLNKLEETNVNEVYFTHHPSFDYYLVTNNKNVVSFHSDQYFDSSWIKTSVSQLNDSSTSKKNLTFIFNYKGKTVLDDHHNKLVASLNGLIADSVKKYYLQKDQDFEIKKRFFKDYPEYNTTIVKYYGVKGNINQLKVWEKNQ